MKLKKLDVKGFSQHAVMALVIVVVALGGTYYLVASHADACNPVSGPVTPTATSSVVTSPSVNCGPVSKPVTTPVAPAPAWTYLGQVGARSFYGTNFPNLTILACKKSISGNQYKVEDQLIAPKAMPGGNVYEEVIMNDTASKGINSSVTSNKSWQGQNYQINSLTVSQTYTNTLTFSVYLGNPGYTPSQTQLTSFPPENVTVLGTCPS